MTSSRPGAPLSCGSKLRPSSGVAVSAISPPASSHRVGQMSMSEADPATRRAREAPWRVDDQGYAAGGLVEAHFVPKSALAQHIAVIGEQQYEGIVGEAGLCQRGEQHADLIVDV